MPAKLERASPLGTACAALWANTPGRLAYALRLTLVCCVSGLIGLWFEIPDPALIVYLGLFLNRRDRTSGLLLAVVMQLFITALVFALVPVTALLIDVPFWRTVAMAVLSFGLMFLGSASKLRPFAASMALITAYVLDLLGSLPASELATRGLLYALLFVGVPAGVSVLADLLIAPAPRRLAGELLARALGSAADLLVAPGDADRARFDALRHQTALDTPKLLKLAKLEGALAPGAAAAYGAAAAATVRILAAVDLIDRCPDAALREALAAALAPTLRAMAAILAGGGYPIGIDAPWWPSEVPADLAPALATVTDAITGFATTPAPPPTSGHAEKAGFFVPDAFTNPAHAEYAVKVTIGAMLCYLLFALWDWPGIHTAMITCYIVGLGTAAETIEKLSLRIAGCLVGAALGLATLVYVLPAITTITGILLVVAAGMFLASWVAAGDARISYAGFQLGFAFLLCTLQGHGPEFDLSVSRDRVLGVLLGTGISYLLFTRLWPVSMAGTIDPAIARLVVLLHRAASAAGDARAALVVQAMAAATAIRRSIALAAFEPGRLRPSDPWIDARRDLLVRIGKLESPLLLAQPGAEAALETLARDADALATAPAPQSEKAVSLPPPTPPAVA
ncbi:FUSC family protein [uncultured Sphingomonas sp.]|uniref:FUSC family protein n=1 Tax=uncultured Sphingomonas sp. TaxID=158754 RepID=UPI0025F111FD|nr:FUSC family protein [uncultured Sphingomonas sp.]